jgi:malonyl-CoA decarboxylase
MPDEPLIFVEVALVNGVSTNLPELFDEKAPAGDPKEADTAIFYSISNCQKGLAGVSFGNFLIKRVVADLKSNLPNLKTFSTLSPIPGFVGWVKTLTDDNDLFHREADAITLLQTDEFTVDKFREIIDPDDDTAKEVKERAKIIEQSLLRLCGRYLLEEKRGSQAYDKVAHFHLTNGAKIKQINWAADLTTNGIMQAAGMMVNYLYDLPTIEKNHEAYSSKGTIAALASVKKIVK